MSEKKDKPTLSEELISYVNMRGGFGILLSLLFVSVAMMCFIAALTVLIARATGSVLWALVIVGGAFLIISLIAFLLRDRLIVNSMVRMFSRMFFEKNDDDDEDTAL